MFTFLNKLLFSLFNMFGDDVQQVFDSLFCGSVQMNNSLKNQPGRSFLDCRPCFFTSLHHRSKISIPPITLFHPWKPGNLFALWQVEGPVDQMNSGISSLAVFVATARAQLRKAGRLKLRYNMCLCLFRCGFPVETRTLPLPDSQMYPVYDSVWSQSPIFKALHSCSVPQPDYRGTVLYCSV